MLLHSPIPGALLSTRTLTQVDVGVSRYPPQVSDILTRREEEELKAIAIMKGEYGALCLESESHW